jgi:putative transposase
VEKYLQSGGPRRAPDPKQRWLTFIHNHAKVTVACDFFVVVTATFRTLYVFVIMELGTRRILHQNVTAHPTADWTLQQFREALPGDHPYRFVIHDRDSIFSQDLDRGVKAMGVRVLRTPIRAPKANAVCERLGGSLRRECLDFLIPLTERHLRPSKSGESITTEAGRIPHWVQEFRNPTGTEFRPTATDTGCPPVTVSRRRPCSADYTMNMAW